MDSLAKPSPIYQSATDHPTYRRDIDGLRAVAVLAVVSYHAFPKVLTGGFVGVDVFFVISGFLISTIIFRGLDTNSLSIRGFYFRRVRRIFPALIVAISSTLIAGWLLLFPDEFRQLGQHSASGMAYISNFVLWKEVGYFDTGAESKPLLHLWSLAIEEQFYLLWPFMALIAWRWRKLAWLIVVCLTGSFLLNVLGMHFDKGKAVFFLPLTRFWELLAGSLLAYLMLYKNASIERFSRRFNRLIRFVTFDNALSVLGLTILLGSIVWFTATIEFPGWWALFPIVGSIFIIAASPHSIANRLILSHPLFVWFGLISYPLYLWHWPVLSFLHISNLPNYDVCAAAMLPVVTILAWLTYKYIELPIRARNATQLFKPLFLSTMAIMAVGCTIAFGYIPAKADYSRLKPIIAAHYDWNLPPGAIHETYEGLALYKLEGAQSAEVLYVGDSSVEQYIQRIAEIEDTEKDTFSAAFIYAGGCRPIPNVSVAGSGSENCYRLTDTYLSYAKNHQVRRVVIGGLWNPGLFSDDVFYRFPDGHLSPLSQREGHDAALRDLEDFIAKLRQLNIEVYLIQNIPTGVEKNENIFVNRFSLALHGEAAISYEDFYRPFPVAEAIDPQERDVIQSIAQKTGSKTIDPLPTLCPMGLCFMKKDHTMVYKDKVHLTNSYAKDYSTYMDKTIEVP